MILRYVTDKDRVPNVDIKTEQLILESTSVSDSSTELEESLSERSYQVGSDSNHIKVKGKKCKKCTNNYNTYVAIPRSSAKEKKH